MGFIYDYYINNKNNNHFAVNKYKANITLPRIQGISSNEKPRDFAKYNIEQNLKSFFVPGFLYTWIYNSTKDTDDDILVFSDTDKPKQIKVSSSQIKGSPIVLCLKLDKDYIMGLDLTVFPAEASCIILDTLVDLDTEYFMNLNYESWKGNGQYLPTNIIKYFSLQGMIKQFGDYINSKYHLDIRPTIRKYNIKQIQKPMLIEFWAWKYVPFQINKIYKPKLSLVERLFKF